MKNNERGSITIFVLVASLFFIIVLVLLYIGQVNKIQQQEKLVENLKSEYNSEEKIHEIYNQIMEKWIIKIVLYNPSGEIYDVNEWTNQDLTLKIFYPEEIQESDKYYYIDGVKTKYQENQKITKNCTIKVEYGDYKEEVQATKIDKAKPTVTISPNGAAYEKENYSNGTFSIKVTASDTNGSGVNVSQYAWSTSNTNEPTTWTNFTSGTNISISTKAGRYYLWTKVTDKAGNRSDTKVSNLFYVWGWQMDGMTGEDHNWYYYSQSSGDRLTGWQYLKASKYGEKFWFYLDPNKNGLMLLKWQKIDGYWYYFEPKDDRGAGIMATGWKLIGGSWYYLKPAGFSGWSGPTGSMLYSTSVNIGGKVYNFNSSGVCTNP